MLMQHSDALHLLLFHQQSAEHTPLCQTAESVTCCCRAPYVSCLAFLPQTILQPRSNCHQGSNYFHIRFPLLNTRQYQGKRQQAMYPTASKLSHPEIQGAGTHLLFQISMASTQQRAHTPAQQLGALISRGQNATPSPRLHNPLLTCITPH